jgi:hypothetical protein
MWACHCNIGTALEAADLSWDGLGIIAPGFDLERRLIDVYGPTGFAL